MYLTIMYFIIYSCTVRYIAKYIVDANLFRLGSSILKHEGPGAQPQWGVEPPIKKNQIYAKFWPNA